MLESSPCLSNFHPLVSRWFAQRFARPTEIQQKAWPPIAAGKHVLISAPTGSGKTMTAFLWALNQLIGGTWDLGYTQVLYISPLKALNSDIQRNLIGPIAELKKIFETSAVRFPEIRVLTRSGDTPPGDRRRMQRKPPEILITTPESLNLMLSSASGQSILRGLRTVIMDEIHAVFGNKRGTHLISAVDRLAANSGEFQRLALSATIPALKKVADFVGGWRLNGSLHAPRYAPRQVTIIAAAQTRDYRLQVRFPADRSQLPAPDSIFEPLAEAFKTIIATNRSTLFFTNSRRLCEKLTYLINQGAEPLLAYSHHGSLSREIRREVEEKLKAGALKAIVATNSLELGIDIGALDEVVLVQSPPSISGAVQRVGRSGHQVGQPSRGVLFPTFSHDLISAAVLARAISGQTIEPIEPIRCPLDVLAQIIVSMLGTQPWPIDALFAVVKSSYPFHQLHRSQFERVLNMLAGRYADTRIQALKPKIAMDRLDQTATLRKGTLLSLYSSGGMIPDRGYFRLRHQSTGAAIGELDEEFVWEAKKGQVFTLGAQNWKIHRITPNDVFVEQANPRKPAPPFWKAEQINRDFFFSAQIGEFLERAEGRLQDSAFLAELKSDYYLDEPAAAHLIAYLKRQKQHAGAALPHRHHLLLEMVSANSGPMPGTQLVLHTFWGGRVNRPYALALEAAWQERFGQFPEVYVTNDTLSLVLPHDISGETLLSLVTRANFQRLLRRRLEGSGFFAARFRECAGRALLLPRRKIGQRTPLWFNRLRSQQLLEAVLPYDDFPILLETWRTCLIDEFDLRALTDILSELEAGVLRWTLIRVSHPSPMAMAQSFRQINQYMYMEDRTPAARTSGLKSNLIRELVLTPELRPAVERSVIREFESIRQRLKPGYGPDSPVEMLEWIKERVLISEAEWQQLLVRCQKEQGLDPESLLVPLQGKLFRLEIKSPVPGRSIVLVGALEFADTIISAFFDPLPSVHWEPMPPLPALKGSTGAGVHKTLQKASRPKKGADCRHLLGQWLRYHGPLTPEQIQSALGLPLPRLQAALSDLTVSDQVIVGPLVKDSEEVQVCDCENFEILLRLARAAAAPGLEARQPEQLQLFLSHFQGLTRSRHGLSGLFESLEQLVCLPAAAVLWETEIIPARVRPYDTSWLDSLMQEGDLIWLGSGVQHIAFCFASDLDLLQTDSGISTCPVTNSGPESSPETDSLALAGFPADPVFAGDGAGQETSPKPDLAHEALWQAVWQGKMTHTTFLALRRGIAARFSLAEKSHPDFRPQARRRRHPSRRSTVRAARFALPVAGTWQAIDIPPVPKDLIEAEEVLKDRLRILLDRYGIVFRELLTRERPEFRWPVLFRTLRLMELSGEVVGGMFFKGVSTPQFISQQGLRLLQHELPDKSIYWINAADPASLCGLVPDMAHTRLPERRSSNHLVWHGPRLVVVSHQNGKKLVINTDPDDPNLTEYLGVIVHLLNRQVNPLRSLTIEQINQQEASRSPYLRVLRRLFEAVVDPAAVTLYRRQI